MGAHKSLRGGMAATAILACVFTAGTRAQPASGDRAAIARGQVTYRDSCAVCHGERGRADGPAARALNPPPADLSQLARKYGAFPATHVRETLNGTAPVIAHGNPGMMIWGAMFLADANGDQAKADARIADLVTYIESLQRAK